MLTLQKVAVLLAVLVCGCYQAAVAQTCPALSHFHLSWQERLLTSGLAISTYTTPRDLIEVQILVESEDGATALQDLVTLNHDSNRPAIQLFMQNPTVAKDLEQEAQHQVKPHTQDHGHNHQSLDVLLGDVGGTNIRLKLVQVTPGQESPTKEYKHDKLKVENHKTFEDAIETFLKDAPVRPKVAVIAIAGPVKGNSVRMSNVEQWGDLSGNTLAETLKFDHFIFLNDFEAAAYGASVLKQEQVIHINDRPLHDDKVKAVVGPGTGLGTAMLFPAPFRKRFRSYVIPGEGGHVNFAPSNDLEWEFYNYMKKETNQEHIVLERMFCGPAVPYMFKFFAAKHPDRPEAKDSPTSEEIFTLGVKTPDSIHRMAVDLFVSIYSEFLGDTALRTLCYGGLYLIGGMTVSIADYIRSPSVAFLKKYGQRRPYLHAVLSEIPIVVSKELDLGLHGAFVFARRIVFDLYDKDHHHK